MTLLEKIKDEYAKELHCQGWIELLMEINIKQEELDVHDEIAKRYAKAILSRYIVYHNGLVNGKDNSDEDFEDFLKANHLL